MNTRLKEPLRVSGEKLMYVDSVLQKSTYEWRTEVYRMGFWKLLIMLCAPYSVIWVVHNEEGMHSSVGAEIPVLGRSLLRMRDVSPVAYQGLISVSCIRRLARDLSIPHLEFFSIAPDF